METKTSILESQYIEDFLLTTDLLLKSRDRDLVRCLINYTNDDDLYYHILRTQGQLLLKSKNIFDKQTYQKLTNDYIRISKQCDLYSKKQKINQVSLKNEVLKFSDSHGNSFIIIEFNSKYYLTGKRIHGPLFICDNLEDTEDLFAQFIYDFYRLNNRK
ncbi:hypothetical protein [Halobacteriovorax sp. YZS-1-1]|uniref:hypothetical protein n=1 Tax=unclassified Halobacteriovorax TaxID=2639665 RepID=UPI0039996A03